VSGLEDLGSIGTGDHARGEYVDLSTMPMQIKRARAIDLSVDAIARVR
jgi:hypothetical protein